MLPLNVGPGALLRSKEGVRSESMGGSRDARLLVTRGKRDGTVQGTRWLARHALPQSDQHAASAVCYSMSKICFMIEISDAVCSLRRESTHRKIMAL